MNTWDVQATEQQLSDTRAALVNAQVMANAAYQVCAEWRLGIGPGHAPDEPYGAMAALLAAEDATTPSPIRSHTVISNAELAWQQQVIKLAEVVSAEHGYLTEARAALRDLLANRPKEA